MPQLPKQMRKFGWIAFGLMWIPFATMMLAMLSLPDGSYDWVELPILARYSMVIGGVLAAVAVLGITGASVVGALSNRAVLANGRPATAEILQIAQTGTTINDNPVVRFVLEVRPPDEPAFQAETERLVPLIEIPQIQPGTIVSVKYDPSSRAVALVSAGD